MAIVVAAFALTIHANAACTDPPAVSASVVTHPDRGLALATITHNDATWVQIFIDGASETTDKYTPPANRFDVPVSLICVDEPRELKVMAWKGGFDCEPATFTTTVPALDTTPKLTPVVTVGDTTTWVNIMFEYPNATPGSLKATIHPADGPSFVDLFEAWTGESKGGRSVNYPSPAVIIFEAVTTCTGKSAVKAVSVGMSCSIEQQKEACKECFGTPIHAISGSMYASDLDPLPGVADVVPFQRRYDSMSKQNGAFGSRWSSIFSAAVRTFPAHVPGTDWVNVVTEENAHYLFRGTGTGPYVQFYPESAASNTWLTRGNDGTWTHVDDTRVRKFSVDGLPVSYRNRTSERELLISWTSGRPARIDDSWGAWALLVTTDPQTGHVTSIAPENDPAAAWTYSYSSGLLTQVHSPRGLWRTYEYPPSSFSYKPLGTIRDGAGRLIESHTYQDDQVARSSIQQTDDIVSVSNIGNGRVPGERQRTVTYKNGRQEIYYSREVGGRWRVVEVAGGCTSCGGGSSVTTYDDFGNVARAQDEDGYITVNSYDTNGRNLVRKITALRPFDCDPATHATRCRQDPDTLDSISMLAHTGATVITDYVYADPNWDTRPTTITTSSVLNPAGTHTETLTYDAETGEVLTRSTTGWTGDPLRQETRTTTTALYDGTAGAEFNPAGAFEVAWLTLPQPRGFRRTIDGPRTDVIDVTAFVHYPVHSSVPPLLRGRLAAVRNAAGHITRYEDYDLHGNARRVIDPNGVVSTSTSDALGRLTSTSTQGVAGCDTTADPLCATTLTSTRTFPGTGPLQSESPAGGGVTLYEYDDRARVSSISRGPAATDLRERIETTYDPDTGRKNLERMLARESGAWVEKSRTSYRYDLLARVDRVTNADNSTVGYTYDGAGRVTSVRDENHATPNTFYEYDAGGRLAEVRQELASAAGGFVTTLYAYDRDGNLTSVTDPNGNVTTYVYDDFGQLLRQNSPVSGATVYTYNQAGDLTSSTDANGATSTRTYDALGRVLTNVATRGGESETITWTYDTGTFGVGRISSVIEPSGSTTYAYERRGLLRQEQKTIRGTTYTTAFRYDHAGNRTAMAYPSGNVVTYTFDYAGRPQSVISGTATIVASAKYLPFGPQTELVLGNGTTRRTSYDQRYRPLLNELITAGGPIARYAYTHDPAGNVTAILDQLDHAFDRTFEYDDLNRLTVANSGAALWGSGSYVYDAMGNLQSSVLGAHTRQFAYSGTTPKLTSATAAGAARPVTYDAAGNETIDGAIYSPRNSLAGNATYGYTYDARGVRTITEFASTGTLVSIAAAPAAVRGGESVQGTVTLTEPAPAGGGVVRLMSTSPNVRVPESVVVPAGATSATFTIETEAVTSDVAVNVSATRGTTSSATLTLRRSCAVSSLTVTPSPVTGGTTITATLSLHEPAGAGGVTVALTSSDPAVAPVPTTITVPSGETAVTFEIATPPLTASASVTLTAELCGSVIETLDVLAPFVSELTLDPATVRAGLPSTGTIQLSGPAPAGGAQIALASSDTAVATVPSAVTIAAGSATATFTVSTPVRDSLASAVISATTAGVTTTSLLTVNPCTPVASPPAFEPGEIVWFDDTIPPGVSQAAGWTWDSSQRASGSVSSVNPIATSVHDRYFADSTSRLTPGDADIVFVYALIDPCNPPREIMVAWVDGNGDHRGYWGEDLLQRNGRIRIGDLPPAGEWVRLEMPATRSSLNGRSIHGLELTIDRGRVWFDRAGKRACTTPNPGPLSEFPPDEVVWFDDAPPAGATISGQWIWDTQVRASGTAAHTDTASTGSRAHWFTVGTSPFTPAAQDQLFVYAYIDPCNVPQEILIEWYDGNWAHRSYWGAALVPNSPGTRMGDVPAAGSWIRLAVPAAALNLANRPVHGLAFTVYGGKVWFDRVGIVRCVFTSPASQPVLNPNDFVWFDDAVPAGASLSGTWTWDTTQKVSGTQSMLSSAGSGERWYGFSNAAPIAVGENDILVAHALIDACNPPREITFWWYDGSWSHRPHWGEPIMHTGYSGTSMGAMPAGGEWVQLEMPARGMNLANRSVSAFELWTHSGRVWFDRIGKKTCIAPVAAQPALSQSEVVWFDDAPPPGAVLRGNWTWNAQQRASGTLANMVPPGGESLEHWFDGATSPLTVGTNDVLTVYALIDPCDPPREIMIGWYDGSWEHRAYWGENIYTHGTPGPARRSMGPLPAPGQWVRLEVPASAVGLAGRTVTGMSLYTFAGKATFDRIGLEPGSSAALTSPPAQTPTFRARWSQRFRTLATVLTRGRTGRTASYTAYQFTPSPSPTPAQIVTTTTPALRRYSLYTPELNLLAETAMTSAEDPPIAHEYIWFGGQPVAQITPTTGEIAWYFNDHLGTPVLQTNASAQVIWRVERDPYGTPHAYRAGIERHQPLAFPGQEERGSESDAAYNVFRWYRAGWGRYTQADPIGLDGGINLFLYAAANSIGLTDVLGLDTAGCDQLLGKLENPCEKECCATHDKCYDDYSCSSGSWGKPKCGCDQTAQCKKCNTDVLKCFSFCSLKAGLGTSKKPNYYCAKLHKYISIPKDFPSYEAALKACEYDNSKDCKIPLASPPPKKKPWYSKLFP